MSTIVTRAGKGAPLTHNEVDANFTNLNTDKYQAGDDATFGAVTATSFSGDGSALTGLPAGYSGWTISDGSNFENVGDGDSITFVGSGSAGVSYNPTTNTLTVSAVDTNTTYSAGAGLSLAGTVFSHADTSAQASVNNAGAAFIQDVTLDTYGHITGLVSTTVTPALIGAATSAQGALADTAIQPSDNADLGNLSLTGTISGSTTFFDINHTNSGRVRLTVGGVAGVEARFLDGPAECYGLLNYSGATKIEATSAGGQVNGNWFVNNGNIDVEGNITLIGTVDGRDVAADGAALDTAAALAATAVQPNDSVTLGVVNVSNLTSSGNISATTGAGFLIGTTTVIDGSRNISNVDSFSANSVTSYGAVTTYGDIYGDYGVDLRLRQGDLQFGAAGFGWDVHFDEAGTGKLAYQYQGVEKANISTGGTVTATAFVGDGSGLTNLPAAGATDINGLSDGYSDGTSVGLGPNALANDDGTSNYNIGIGSSALKGSAASTLKGSHNIGIGYLTGEDLYFGSDNILMGQYAGVNLANAYNNIVIGKFAGYNAISTYDAVHLGAGAGRNDNGENNVGIGTGALNGAEPSGLTGLRNVGIGYQAGYDLSSGDYNFFGGYRAGYNVTSGSNNVHIGRLAGDITTTGSNQIVIGYNADPSSATVSNEITLGDATISRLRIPGLGIDWTDNPAAKGGGSDQIFWENDQTVTTSYTITNGKNAMSAGPITIGQQVTVTVGAGETWTVV